MTHLPSPRDPRLRLAAAIPMTPEAYQRLVEPELIRLGLVVDTPRGLMLPPPG